MGINQLDLDTRLLRKFEGEIIRVPTTEPTSGNDVYSTELNNYDRLSVGFFDNRWVYFENGNNAGTSRRVGKTTYDPKLGHLTVYGPSLLADNAVLMIRVTRSDWNSRQEVLAQALRELFPALYSPVVDKSITATSNVLEYPIPPSLAEGTIALIDIDNGGNPQPAWGARVVGDKICLVNGQSGVISLTGRIPMKYFTSEVNELPLTDKQADLVAEKAAFIMCLNAAAPATGDEAQRYVNKAQVHGMRVNEQIGAAAMPSLPGRVIVGALR